MQVSALHEVEQHGDGVLSSAQAEVDSPGLIAVRGVHATEVALLHAVPQVHHLVQVDVAPAQLLRQLHDQVLHLWLPDRRVVAARRQHQGRLELDALHVAGQGGQRLHGGVAAQEVNRGLLLTHSNSPILECEH